GVRGQTPWAERPYGENRRVSQETVVGEVEDHDSKQYHQAIFTQEGDSFFKEQQREDDGVGGKAPRGCRNVKDFSIDAVLHRIAVENRGVLNTDCAGVGEFGIGEIAGHEQRDNNEDIAENLQGVTARRVFGGLRRIGYSRHKLLTRLNV